MVPARGLCRLSREPVGRGRTPGKLTAAARAWALARAGRSDRRTPATVDAEVAAQFARMGAAVPVSGPTAEEAFEVMRGNWDSLTAFLACETQWRVAVGMTGVVWLGLDYGGVDIVLRHRRLAEPHRVFADLQIMESAALGTLAEAG